MTTATAAATTVAAALEAATSTVEAAQEAATSIVAGVATAASAAIVAAETSPAVAATLAAAAAEAVTSAKATVNQKKLKNQGADLAIGHTLHLTHLLAVMDSLYRLVDDTVSYGKHRFSLIVRLDKVQEPPRPLQQRV